ncbi:response regulator [Flexivirga alba]|uniref:Response regulator transcription factor n=1 Tax=Flexivirga alba TaxID=702742 RepID=A0ABW2AJ01_9MICO
MVVADDQTVIRESVAAMLGLYDDIEVVGTAADGEQAVAAAIAEHADVVLMDLNMPRLDGAGATSMLSERAPETSVLILTTYGDDESIMRALDAGARGSRRTLAGPRSLAPYGRWRAGRRCSIRRCSSNWSVRRCSAAVRSARRPRRLWLRPA